MDNIKHLKKKKKESPDIYRCTYLLFVNVKLLRTKLKKRMIINTMIFSNNTDVFTPIVGVEFIHWQ